MKKLFICLTAAMLTACSIPHYISQTLPPEFPVTDTTKEIIIIDNSLVSTSGIIGIKKKQGIVSEIKKQFFARLAGSINTTLHVNAVLDTAKHYDDETLKTLATKNTTAYILVFNSFDEGFERDYIDRQKDQNGQVTKTAYYSIYCTTHLQVYDRAGNNTYKQLDARHQHSSAVIAGALVDIGPSFQGNKNDLLGIAGDNITLTIELFTGAKVMVRQ